MQGNIVNYRVTNLQRFHITTCLGITVRAYINRNVGDENFLVVSLYLCYYVLSRYVSFQRL